MSCSADYYLVTCSQRRLLCADVCSAHTSRCYQNRKFTVPSQFGIVDAANWQRQLVCAEHTSAHTITTVKHSQHRIVRAANVGSTDQAVLHDVITHDKLFQHILVALLALQRRIVGATNVYKRIFSRIFYGSGGGAQKNSRRYKKFAAPTIPTCEGKVNFLFWQHRLVCAEQTSAHTNRR